MISSRSRPVLCSATEVTHRVTYGIAWYAAMTTETVAPDMNEHSKDGATPIHGAIRYLPWKLVVQGKLLILREHPMERWRRGAFQGVMSLGTKASCHP